MRQQFPRTLAYLERFRDLLSARAAYRRYQGRGPFYSMYNVGPYTIAPVKVVWRRMDRRINAAVIEFSYSSSTGAGGMPSAQQRPMIPQETCVLVACESADEAHYICAVLNSAMVNELVLRIAFGAAKVSARRACWSTFRCIAIAPATRGTWNWLR